MHFLNAESVLKLLDQLSLSLPFFFVCSQIMHYSLSKPVLVLLIGSHQFRIFSLTDLFVLLQSLYDFNHQLPFLSTCNLLVFHFQIYLVIVSTSPGLHVSLFCDFREKFVSSLIHVLLFEF